jgi:hypothetical protein
MSENEYKHFL